MTSHHAFAGGALCLVIVGCSAWEMPSPPISPTPAAQRVPAGLVPQNLALGEAVEMNLDGTVISGTWYCEIGNDPAPCQLFVLDVPRAGTVVIRLEFDGDAGMFIEIGNLALGPHLSFQAGGSPLVASATVRAGALPFRVGLNLPWGRNGYVVRFRVVATLE